MRTKILHLVTVSWSTRGYFEGRSRLEHILKRRSGGSGTGFGAHDASWYYKTEKGAVNAKKRLRNTRWLDSVHVDTEDE